MDDAAKALIFKGWHNFVGIAHQLGDLRVVEEFLRPGVEPRHLLRAGVKLNRGEDSAAREARIAV